MTGLYKKRIQITFTLEATIDDKSIHESGNDDEVKQLDLALLHQLIISSPEKADLLLADAAVNALDFYQIEGVSKEILGYPCDEGELPRYCLRDAIEQLLEPYGSEWQRICTYEKVEFNEISQSIRECFSATIIEQHVSVE
ncbi:hypothetical protein [Ktedonobacter robiniae]|uniref:Uncharacterized protein n=1 Tax=Ktedonobacter robiniae TaxID=2778365 RepID=A0ABQ3V297_9CHLR|nr:hypothetical protein [Ktedonobacter robiniae]GHO59286.1 hypothetical protein KSB_77610 [Ktedonobacter robiniae]